MKNDELTYSDVMTLASELKIVAGQLEELLFIVKEDYNDIGRNGTVWSGTTASNVKNVFNLTAEKTPIFVSQINSYADAIVNDLIRNEDQ